MPCTQAAALREERAAQRRALQQVQQVQQVQGAERCRERFLGIFPFLKKSKWWCLMSFSLSIQLGIP